MLGTHIYDDSRILGWHSFYKKVSPNDNWIVSNECYQFGNLCLWTQTQQLDF